ncbi:hypothetical protein P5V15_002602 [Pogonomyrmex californicus]
MKEGIRGVREEIKKITNEQREEIRLEVERMREELKEREREEKWIREREEMKERIEKMKEELERSWRKRNIIIKRLKEGEKEVREKAEEILEKVGGVVKVEEIRRIEAGRKEKGEMIIIKLKSEETRRRIMGDKWKLKGNEVRIEKMTWEERNKMEIKADCDKGGMEGIKGEGGGRGDMDRRYIVEME